VAETALVVSFFFRHLSGENVELPLASERKKLKFEIRDLPRASSAGHRNRHALQKTPLIINHLKAP
jgi:hypothetical protein